VHREPPPVRRWAPQVPEPLVAVCDRALAKDKEKRFGSASEMRAALAAARRARPVPALNPPPLPPSHSGRTRRAPPSTIPPIRRPRPASSSSAGSVTPPLRGRRALPWVAAGAALALIALLAVTLPWWRGRGSGDAPVDGGAQVGELTRALVATQVQLAQRELDDKNWQAAQTQAQSALRLAPGQANAVRILETARARVAELDSAIAAARDALGAGDTEAASGHLSRVLELDPRHPAATELSARLNAVFRTEADAAADAMRAARESAMADGAAGSREFQAALSAARDAEALVGSEEFADATRIFLEARDAFDRAGRTARSRQQTAANAAATPASTPVPRAASSSGKPPAGAASAIPPSPPRFVAERTTVTTPAAGRLAGFESDNVDARQAPRFEGRLEFEVLPSAVDPGEPFVVRVKLVNEGRRSVRVEGIALAVVDDGRRTAAPTRVLQRRAPAGERALVAEYSAVWSPTRSWSLEVVAALEGNEQVRSRLKAE